MWWWVQRQRTGSLKQEREKQRNSDKVRVGAFCAISVLFESRWVMWSCCLSAVLSLRLYTFLFFFPVVFTELKNKPLCQKETYLYLLEILPQIISRNNMSKTKAHKCLAKYKPRLCEKILSCLIFFPLCMAFHFRLSKSVRILLWKGNILKVFAGFQLFSFPPVNAPLCSTRVP